MPCNIGYKETYRARLAAPTAQSFQARGQAPRVDAELLDRIGVDDPEFVEWFRDLDVRPLLQVALDRVRGQSDARGINLSVASDGSLIIEGRAGTEARAEVLLGRWQMEVLAVVAQLLGYQTRIEGGRLEGDRAGSEGVAEHFSVTPETGGSMRLRFEHFKTPAALREEVRKVIALARLCGIPLTVEQTAMGGLPDAEPPLPGNSQAEPT